MPYSFWTLMGLRSLSLLPADSTFAVRLVRSGGSVASYARLKLRNMQGRIAQLFVRLARAGLRLRALAGRPEQPCCTVRQHGTIKRRRNQPGKEGTSDADRVHVED